MAMMMKKNFSRFLTSGNILLGRTSEIRSSFGLSAFNSQRGISTAGPEILMDTNYGGKRYAQYTVFKGKSALSMYPILPKLTKMNSDSLKVDKSGCIMLTFWPAIGLRKYDWQKKQVFALSPTEVGNLISLGPAESCEFMHDPSMKSSLEGQVKKSLSVAPLGNDNGYFINLSVLNNVQKTNERFSVPVTKAEFAVMRTVFNYVLPHIMGWDQVVKTSEYSPKPNPIKQQMELRPDPDSEWER